MTDNKRRRLTPDERRGVILAAARRVASRHENPLAMTRAEVAEACDIPTSFETVKLYFPHMADLRKAATE